VAKIGRNEPCPCGSKKKYKRCHGSPANRVEHPSPYFEKTLLHSEAERIQRERQQGLGNPIISTYFNGVRLVAVKNRLMQGKHWRTFHDFLSDYIKLAIGPAWGNAEIAKPANERHPILNWYQSMCASQATRPKKPGEVVGMQMTGAIAAYMGLAYDLYAIDHNAVLQDRLLARLRNRDTFWGARYELFVAAIFVRAGFTIEFEDEDDGNTTHCEFTATHRQTGKSFSVEAKRKEQPRLRVGHLFNSALQKRANHQRIIFIDTNEQDDARDETRPHFFDVCLKRLRSFEYQPLKGVPRPPAYVFLTNAPWDLSVEAIAPRMSVLSFGFQIPDFFGTKAFPSLRHAIDAREANIEMHSLLQSLQDHSGIPSTFDGEIPEYAFDVQSQRIVIGNRYMVNTDDAGAQESAELTFADVVESESVAFCGFTLKDGRTVICKMPLSPADIAAWKRHPDTFFGVVKPRTTRADTPLQLYDFFHNQSKGLTKDRLLTVLANHPDIAQLAELDQGRLASVHAERMANGAMLGGFLTPAVNPKG
jgi:hypothetical protein